MNIDLDVVEVQANCFAIGDQARSTWLVDQSAKLTETPAKAAARVVGDIPKEVGELLAPVLPTRGRQITEKRACLFRWGQI